MNEFEFIDCLRSRYGGQDYALLPQVRSTTGFARRVRTADALAVSLWPSRGLGVEGFEFKRSRNDWLRELKEPAKAEEIARFCRHWWMVVSDPAIVADGELPTTWGLMHASGGKVKVVKAAPYRESEEPGWSFVASVLRAAVDAVTPESEIARRIDIARDEERRAARSDYDARLEKERAQAAKDKAAIAGMVREFEIASGISLSALPSSLNGGAKNRRLGEAVKFVLAGGLEGQRRELAALAADVERIRAVITGVMDAVELSASCD